MGYSCVILADHKGPTGARFTTYELEFPACIQAQFNKHRMLSVSTESSRAVPTAKLVQRVLEDPFVPVRFGTNKKGMQPGGILDPERAEQARMAWLEDSRDAVRKAERYAALGVHKELANRPLNLYMWARNVVTATEWDNLWLRRCHHKAQGEFFTIASMMKAAMEASTPTQLQEGQWHLPYISDADHQLVKELGLSHMALPKVSAARCARVSYKAFDGTTDLLVDLDLAERLLADGDLTPFEHTARATLNPGFIGNHRSWCSLRKMIPGEAALPAKT